MSYDLKAKDLTEYGFRIDKADSIDTARAIFIEMVNNFDFKSKQQSYIDQAKSFSRSKRDFNKWAWNIILSSQGLGVI